ncbi:unnamed protein product [Mytilus coruscus]|uniref:CCHC-type domain-containing protein n=1 Tax=Mytilus coruscus TaxID=42192 RepID=A0A6J8D615_MYTCO|nr:unnamed protein product [Mytilus coruscus]
MNAEVEALCKKMTHDRLLRLLGLQGTEPFIVNEEETVRQDVNNEKMATYAEVTSDTHLSQSNTQSEQSNIEKNTHYSKQKESSDPSDLVKPIVLKDQDMHCSVKPPRAQWLTNVEIFKSIGAKVPKQCIKGIQRIREMWRIYMDNEEYLRIDGKLTACETGDRLVISKTLDKPIPRNLPIGKYFGRIFHAGQPEFQNNNTGVMEERTCHKCLKPGHMLFQCPDDLAVAQKSGKDGNSDNVDKAQPPIDRFVRTPHRRTVNASDRSPPTEALHDKTSGNFGTKKTKA